MMRLLKFSTFVVLWVSGVGFAQSNPPISQSDCQFVDYSDKFGPIRNQGETGSCFAFATADLISYKSGKTASALDIIALHNDALKMPLTFEKLVEKNGGGWAAYALLQVFESGFCLESETNSEPTGRDVKTDLTLLENTSFHKVPFGIWQNMFTNLTKTQAEEVFNSFPTYDRVNQLALKNCSKRIPFVGYTFDQKLKKKVKEKLIPILNEVIQSQPVIINYNSSDLLASGNGGSHFSTIVARRWNSDKKRCEFRIRNTWGTTNANYAPDIETLNGYQWVGEGFLNKNLYEILYLKLL